MSGIPNEPFPSNNGIDAEPSAAATAAAATEGARPNDVKSMDAARDAFRRGDVEASRAEHEKRAADHTEKHGGTGSDYVKAIVFGGMDGIITTFSVVTAAAGSGNDWKQVLIFGISNVFSDGFSMGFGETISSKAEMDFALKEREREEWEVEHGIELERKEMVDIYVAKGMSETDATTVVDILSKDKKIFVDTMMVEELGIMTNTDDPWEPYKHGVAMFISFVCFGLLPLLPYFSGRGNGADFIFGISIALTGVALLILGAVKGYLSHTHMAISAIIMLLQGAVNGGISYGVGRLVEYIVSVV